MDPAQMDTRGFPNLRQNRLLPLTEQKPRSAVPEDLYQRGVAPVIATSFASACVAATE